MLPAGQPSIVDKLESLLDEPVLAMNLGRDNTSTIGLGVADSTLYKGSLVSVPLNISSGQWDVNNITYMVDGQSVSTPYSRATALSKCYSQTPRPSADSLLSQRPIPYAPS